MSARDVSAQELWAVIDRPYSDRLQRLDIAALGYAPDRAVSGIGNNHADGRTHAVHPLPRELLRRGFALDGQSHGTVESGSRAAAIRLPRRSRLSRDGFDRRRSSREVDSPDRIVSAVSDPKISAAVEREPLRIAKRGGCGRPILVARCARSSQRIDRSRRPGANAANDIIRAIRDVKASFALIQDQESHLSQLWKLALSVPPIW